MNTFSPFNYVLGEAKTLKHALHCGDICPSSKVTLVAVHDVIMDIHCGKYDLVKMYVGADFLTDFIHEHNVDIIAGNVVDAAMEENIGDGLEEDDAFTKACEDTRPFVQQLQQVHEIVKERIECALSPEQIDRVVNYHILSCGRIACEIKEPLIH